MEKVENLLCSVFILETLEVQTMTSNLLRQEFTCLTEGFNHKFVHTHFDLIVLN